MSFGSTSKSSISFISTLPSYMQRSVIFPVYIATFTSSNDNTSVFNAGDTAA